MKSDRECSFCGTKLDNDEDVYKVTRLLFLSFMKRDSTCRTCRKFFSDVNDHNRKLANILFNAEKTRFYMQYHKKKGAGMYVIPNPTNPQQSSTLQDILDKIQDYEDNGPAEPANGDMANAESNGKKEKPNYIG
jgi:hypothetical protein